MTVYKPHNWFGSDGERFIMDLDQLRRLAWELTHRDIRPDLVKAMVRAIVEEKT